MIDLGNPTESQQSRLLGEIGQNSSRLLESFGLESGTAKIAMGLVRGTDPEKCVKPSSVAQDFIGVLVSTKTKGVFMPDEEYIYQAGEWVLLIRKGHIDIAPIVAVNAGESVFLETSGINAGFFTNTASASTIALNATFEETTISAGQICKLLIN